MLQVVGKGNAQLQKILDGLNQEVALKKDFIIHPQDFRMSKEGLIVSRDRSINNFQVTDWALGKLAEKVGHSLSVRYLRNCPPELQAVNVNHWLSKTEYDVNNPWLIRTKTDGDNGIVRSFLSDKYTAFDDNEVMDIINSFLGGDKANVNVNMWHRDDTGFHLRITFDDLATTIGTTPDGRPDVHKVGIHIENSEVGKKSLKITPLIWRLVCSNGLMGWGVDGEGAFRQAHVHLNHQEMYGRVAEAIGTALKVGDSSIEKLIQAKQTPIADPLDVIKKLSEKNKYSKEFTEKVQGKFLEESGNNAFYVVQAFTRACQETKSVDFRTDVEQDATRMLEQLIKIA